MSPFEPKRKDGRPVWRVIFDHIQEKMDAGTLEVGSLLSHKELKGLLTEEEKQHYYQLVGKTRQELVSLHKRYLASARGAGYRLIAGIEQIGEAENFKKKARKSLGRGLKLSSGADRSLMSAPDRTWADRFQNGLVALALIARQHDEQLIQLGEQMETLKADYETGLSRKADQADLDGWAKKFENRLRDIERRRSGH